MIIQNKQIRINVFPELGGTLGEFSYFHNGQNTDIFRKADVGSPTLKNISFFVMGPWIARIPERKFFWEGKEIFLEHPADVVNGIHGIFRQFSWDIKDQQSDSITLAFNFKNGDKGYTFISDFSSEIRYSILDSMLKVEISLINTSSVTIPCSFGSHPMILKRKENAIVKFDAENWFPPDPKLLVPNGSVDSIPGELNAPDGRELPENWDHCLSNWKGDAKICWPKEGIELIVGKEDVYSNYLQCWSGAGREVFALEQQTGPANSFNLLNQGVTENGVIILDPGKSVNLVHTYTMRSL